MASTLATIRTRVLDNLGGRTDKTSQATTWVNTAQDRILRYHLFKAAQAINTTFSFTDGTETYTLVSVATDCKTILNIRIPAEDVVMEYIPWQLLDSLVPYPTNESESCPLYWYQQDKTNFGTYPIADTTYTAYIRYTDWASTLSNDTDIVAFEHMDDVIQAAATVEGFLHLGEGYFPQARNWEVIFGQRLIEAIAEDNRQPNHEIVLGQYRPPSQRPTGPRYRQTDALWGMRGRLGV